MNYKELSTKVHALVKGQLGVNVVARISCDKMFLASGKIYLGRVEKVTLGVNVRMVSYEGMVNAKADVPFVPSAPKGMTWIDYPYFKQSIKEGKDYLVIHYRVDSKTDFDSFYLLDGKLASKAEAADIESRMKAKSSYSQKQSSAGITNEKDQAKVVQYLVSGVQYFGTDKGIATQMWESLKG